MSYESENFDCPCCGAEVSARANFCRECGASDDSGWGDEAEEGFGTDDDFDYEEFIEREFATTRSVSKTSRFRRAFTVVIIVLVCISLALLSILGS